MTTPAHQPDALVAFLRAQLDDDERDSERVHYSLCPSVALRGPGPCDCGFPEQRRVEVDAKRRILDLHGRSHECSIYDRDGDVDHCTWVLNPEECSTLRLLALPYADRPGYQERWRP